MALDINKIRQRLEEAKGNGTKSNGTYFWRPQDGTQDIRIIAPEDGDPFKDYWFHYNLGAENRGGVLCPKKNHGEDCPICDLKDQLWKEFNESQDPDTMKMAKDLTPRQRFFSPVIVRSEESRGVRVWGYGKEAYTSLLNLVLNPEYGDITDTEDGTDLTLTYGKPPGANYPKTTLTPRRRSSPLSEDTSRTRELIGSIPEFDKLFVQKSQDEIQGILDNFMSSLDGAAVEDATPQQASSSEAQTDVSAVFNELMNS